ncbi:hypothetical protein CVT24_008205 [Panaeolus cyanescens]|uniref:BTB domain-containing protein n=1 Tax=Panaeolus cyanescens TaxID=181874 RepID=A0A409VF11_9AGAR|nr:hypothetical protein CVT24_008205 [Panaeolus cyanescens]
MSKRRSVQGSSSLPSFDNGRTEAIAGPSTLVTAVTVRKRGRCDSDPQTGAGGRPPEKMSRSHDDDNDTDTEMDTLMGTLTPNSSIQSLTSEIQLQRVERPNNWRRDDDFYYEDGSCIILVEDVLFNVHRSMLSRDSSSFKTMFSLPQGQNVVEGHSDVNPIMLVGDTPEEFRHFLWALYALPPELALVTSSEANITLLIDIGRVSNKYSFKSLETWALDAIQKYVTQKPSPILAPPHAQHSSNGSPSTIADQVTRLIRLAQLCHHARLLETMIGLLRQLMTTSVQYAYLAMTLADELDLRSLRGAAYLEVMQKATVVKKISVNVVRPSSSAPSLASNSSGNSAASLPQLQSQDTVSSDGHEGTIDSSGRLIISKEQQLRLLAGYYRLTSTWDQLRLTPLPFDHATSCGATWHQQGCTQSWLEFWKEKTRSEGVMNLGLADVLGRLRLVQKEYERWGSATYMHHDCRLSAKKAISDVIKRVEEALPDYFSDPGDD